MASQRTEQTYKHYIGGGWTNGDGSETFTNESPVTGETLGSFARGTESDLNAGCGAAKKTTEEWSELSPINRAEYLWLWTTLSSLS